MNLMINYSSKWWYKLITIILVFALILYFSIGFAPKASAVVVSTVIVGSVLAAMAATGIGLAVSGMTSQELTQWVSDKLNDWTADIGGSVQDHIDNNLITVTANGILSIGSAAAQGISDFIYWLQTEDSITDNSTSVIETTNASLNGYQLGVLPFSAQWDTRQVVMTSDYTTYFYYRESPYAPGYYSFYYISVQQATVSDTLTVGDRPYGHTTYVNNLYLDYYYAQNSQFTISGSATNFDSNLVHEVDPTTIIGNGEDITQGTSLSYDTNVINIPTIDTNEKWYLDVGADAGEDVDTVTDGVITDTLTNTLEVNDEIVESNAQEVVIVNEDAIAVNVDHHMIGFTNLPDFAHLNLNSIWHYVSDAVDFASSWLAWFISFLTAMPLLAIPLYMSFTLLVVLSFLRRFI